MFDLKLECDNECLRKHQIEAKRNILEAWGKCNSVMLQMPTGTGKTFLFSSIINDIVTSYKRARRDINILVVAHRMELIDQISETLDRFGISHGFIQGAREQHLWKRVQVASIMSLLTEKNYSNTLRQQFDFIIVDEAHHSLADTYKELFRLFPNAKKLGVTATPWRLNHESFLPLYDVLVTTPQVSWFIKNGLLADFDYVSIRPNSEIQRLVNESEIATTGDFVNSDLDHTFNNQRIRSKLLDSYFKYANGRKGIVYAINKIHAARISDMYNAKGVSAVAIDCDTPKEERAELIYRFRQGEIKILVNVEIFTEGFDCPDVAFIQLARPTRSLALYLQQVGRGLRVVKGKDKTIILDNVGLYNYFGLPDANRKWQFHFKGSDGFEPYSKGNSTICGINNADFSFDESRLEEDSEPMLRVHGTQYEIESTARDTEEQEEKEEKDILQNTLEIEEFVIADYYLVRGHKESFKVYTMNMKRGKLTGGVGSVAYDFSGETPIVFKDDAESNKQIVAKNIKLSTVLTFAASRLNIRFDELFNLRHHDNRNNISSIESICLFDFLKELSIRK